MATYDLNLLAQNIKDWATVRGISCADPSKQMLKMVEELGELAEGIAKGWPDQIIDGIGDVFIVLTILSLQCGYDISQCVHVAFNEIRDRSGVMVDGVFVKDGDLS